MHTATCNHRGCAATFSHPTQKQADQALRMHVGRKHKRNITTLRGSDLKPKRTYTRRKPVKDHHHGGANYCPHCGFNLAMLNVAMQVASKVK